MDNMLIKKFRDMSEEEFALLKTEELDRFENGDDFTFEFMLVDGERSAEKKRQRLDRINSI